MAVRAGFVGLEILARGFLVRLPLDADWTGAVRSAGNPIANDADVQLRFVVGPDVLNDVVIWSATRDADDDHLAWWNVDELVVRPLIAQKPTKARIHYVRGGSNLLWDAEGKVINV